MRKVITLMLHDRPVYTRAVLQALRRCDGIEEYLILPHVEPGNDRVLALAKEIDFAEVRLTVNRSRLGIGANTRRAWEDGFRYGEFIIHLEDDTVPAPDCLRFFEYCGDAYRRDQSVFSVSAYNRQACRASARYDLARRRPYTCWGVGIWKDRWDWVKGHWSPDPERYATHLRNHLTGFQLQEVYPLLSRIQNIGARGGVHVRSPEWHREHQHTEHWAGALDLPPGAYRESAPPVTAVMITGLHRARYPLARVAIDCFLKQTYPNRELLIINHGPEALAPADSRVRELRIRKRKNETVGDLRNIGLREAGGDFVITWDDDDWHHPGRIRVQMDAREGSNAPVFLSSRIHYNFLNGCAGYNVMPAGADATILHPRDVSFRYPSLLRGSDTVFAQQFSSRIVTSNDPGLYIRFFHGLNLWDVRHVMGELGSPERRNEVRLRKAHRSLLTKVLALYRDWNPPDGSVHRTVARARKPPARRRSAPRVRVKPRLQHLILVPQNGLCNRLRAIASARRLSARLGARCSIVWDWGRFENFFAPVPGVEWIGHRSRPADRVIEHQSWHIDSSRAVDVSVTSLEVRSGHVFWGTDESPIQLRQVVPLIPVPNVRLLARINDFAARHLRNAVGFHIRRTDSRQSIQVSPDELFIEAGRRVVSAGRKILLCTDNAATEERMRTLFGSAVITTPKQRRMSERWPRAFDAAALEDDLIDLFLLARTRYVLGSFWSSFSGLAIALNGSRFSRILISEPATG